MGASEYGVRRQRVSDDGALAFWSVTWRDPGPGCQGVGLGGTRGDRDRCLDGSAKAGSPLRSAPALQNVDKGLAKPGLPRRSPQGEGGFMDSGVR